jgi:hypothetical protein
VSLRAGLFDDRHANEMLASSNNNKALLRPSVFLPRIAALFRVVATLAADHIIRIKDWHLGVWRARRQESPGYFSMAPTTRTHNPRAFSGWSHKNAHDFLFLI